MILWHWRVYMFWGSLEILVRLSMSIEGARSQSADKQTLPCVFS